MSTKELLEILAMSQTVLRYVKITCLHIKPEILIWTDYIFHDTSLTSLKSEAVHT